MDYRNTPTFTNSKRTILGICFVFICSRNRSSPKKSKWVKIETEFIVSFSFSSKHTNTFLSHTDEVNFKDSECTFSSMSKQHLLINNLCDFYCSDKLLGEAKCLKTHLVGRKKGRGESFFPPWMKSWGRQNVNIFISHKAVGTVHSSFILTSTWTAYRRP